VGPDKKGREFHRSTPVRANPHRPVVLDGQKTTQEAGQRSNGQELQKDAMTLLTALKKNPTPGKP
jgi:hypothetical protein